VGEVFQRERDEVFRSEEARMRTADWALALLLALPKPRVGNAKTSAAVIALGDHQLFNAAFSDDEARVRHSVRNTGKGLSQMQGGVFTVFDAEEQHLSIEVVNAPDRAVGPMRRRKNLWRTNGVCQRARRCKRTARVGAANHTRLAPEQLGGDAHSDTRGRGRIEDG
jgi:hypothetical protein